MSQDLLAVARAAMSLAKKHGVSDVAASASSQRNVDTTWRDGKLEKVSEATQRQLSLSLYVDGKYGSMSTNDLRPPALDRFVEDAVGLVRALAKDPHRKLPDPSLYRDRPSVDLEIFDESVSGLSTDARLTRAKAMEEGARSVMGAERILSVSADVGDGSYEVTRVTSNGFEGTYRGTSINTYASVSVKDDDGRRPEDWAGASTRFAADLPSPLSIGKDAAERALSRLRSQKVASGTMPILVEARAAGSLLRHLIGPLGGGALQQKESFYADKVGVAVASKTLTLIDDPLLKRGLGSRVFDGEGLSSRRLSLIDRGVLKSYLIDVYYGDKLGMPPTTGRTSNLIVEKGQKSLAAMLKDMKEGLLITGFLGGNSNSTTGVFSLGAQGYRVSNGQKVEPIAELNLSDKHLDFWKKLVVVGDDPYVYSSTRVPSLLFERVSIAGK